MGSSISAQANVGVYAGYTQDGVNAFEDWLGADVDFVGVHAGQKDWSDWLGSINGLIRNFKDVDAKLAWSLPMIVNGSSLTAAAAGAYDSYYLQAAKALAAASPANEPIYVRIGEEFNGNWMVWAAKGKEKEFIATFQKIVDIFRSVSSNFKFEWNVNIGDNGMDPATAYPGDAYVDIIGMDFYYKSQYDNANTLAQWNYNVTRKYGLQWLEDFAAAHNKPTAYSEWGIDSTQGAAYIAAAQAWFASHNVVYQIYWDVNYAGTNQYRLDDGRNSSTATAYKEAFGDITDTTYTPNLSQSVLLSSNAPLTTSISVALTVSPNDTWLRVGDKNLTLTGTANSNGVGNAIDNIIVGNAGDNLLRGEGGADTLYGSDGHDTLNGGAGNDLMYGGKGNDIYIADVTSDRIVEGANEGTDTVYTYATYTLPANVENLVGWGTAPIWMKANDLANTITGNEGANTIYGEAGADIINGAGGADRIIGGLGNDTLTGGAGADTFVFVRDQSGKDTITDFGSGGRDVLELTTYLSAKMTPVLTNVGSNVVISFSNGESITLVGVQAADLTATSTGYIYH